MLVKLETIYFNFPVAIRCWNKLGLLWCNSSPISERILLAKSNFTGPCFFEIFRMRGLEYMESAQRSYFQYSIIKLWLMESVLPFRFTSSQIPDKA
jgi:hypothetical protein